MSSTSKSNEEMRALFSRHPRSVATTRCKIAEQCNLDFEFGHTKLPHFRGARRSGSLRRYFREPLLQRALRPATGSSPSAGS